MIFRIKCSSNKKVFDVWNIMQSHIINSPEDDNMNDCIVFFTIDSVLTPIYKLNLDTFMEYIVKNNIIEFNNSTSIIALEFIADGLGYFVPVGNDIFQLDY